MEEKKYLRIVNHYENCLDKYGDTPQGVDWPKKEMAEATYRVMLEVIKPNTDKKVSFLDFGCGASHLYEYIQKRGIRNIEYSGLDISQKYIDLSRRKFPSLNFYLADILDQNVTLPDFDYIILNGVFTEKRELTFDEMFAYFQPVILKVFAKARIGIAFNLISKQVDWERDDLFHMPLDTLAWFLKKNVSRHFIIRHDYELYSYTTYVYREPNVAP